MKALRREETGFTLIELMIVVAIIGILAAIAIPRFASLIRKANEGSSKGNLGSIRSALSIYYGDMEGQFPQTLAYLTQNTKYLGQQMPISKAPNYHPDATNEVNGNSSNDGGGWLYDNLNGDVNEGNVWVNCTHTDTKASVWTFY